MDSINSLSNDVKKIMPDLVVNAAAMTSIEECEKNPGIAETVNTEIASKLAEVCNHLKIKFVHISSDHFCSGSEKYSSENSEVMPLNSYAKTKYQAELSVQKLNANSLIIRTNFFAWGTFYRKSFSDFVIENLRNNNEIKLFTDIYHTPILVNELVIWINKLIELDEFGVFNIVSSERISKYDFGIKIAKIFNLDNLLIKSCQYEDQEKSIIRPFDMSLSNVKLLNRLQRKMPSLTDQLYSLKRNEKSILKCMPK